ncbi:ATPase, T2SS/T4P/T4SS family [Ralstonia sp. UBA689]|uniref:ATPase, T2SS/T4P/T4SS family n=1 Tax=Ralstonia sp. UBA689 TaxID=1947373 RepID=UPI0025E7D8AC|nr:ATPase, T2SS/T4P/T4SS family [Ralstonia sp. UBA689]
MLTFKVQGPKGELRQIDVTEPRCKIGTDKRNAVVLSGWTLGREHAEILMSNDGIFVRDLKSAKGTFVNGKRIDTHGPLLLEDEIRIGDYRIAVAHAGAAQASFMEASPASAPTPVQVAAPPAPRPAASAAQPAPAFSPASAAAPVPAAPVQPAFDRELFELRKLLQEKLVEAFDLRRIDIHNMPDAELRALTEQTIRQIIDRTSSEIPPGINRESLMEMVRDEAIGLGPLEPLLADSTVTEIMVNSANDVFIEQNGTLSRCPVAFTSDRAVIGVIERIVAPLGRRIDESSPMVDARLKDGSRVNAIIAPLALKGPSLTIRKFAKRKLVADDLLRFGSANAAMMEFLRVCVQYKKNVVISGGTGSGKTTLLNILSNFIPEHERVVTIEDAAELQLHHANLVGLEARPANLEGKGHVSIRDLVRNSLRMRPDRIVVGECRGGEALDMLQAMNTGHDGSLTTAHANTPRDMLSRLEVMVLMAGMDLPVTAIREQIASAVDIVVQQTRFACGTRKITHITEVTGVESGKIQLQDVFNFVQTGLDSNHKVKGHFTGCGFVPEFYEHMKSIGMDLDLSIFARHDPREQAQEVR